MTPWWRWRICGRGWTRASAAAITLADLAAWLGIDLPNLTDTDPDAGPDADADADTADTHGADGTGGPQRGAEGEPGTGADGAGGPDTPRADAEAGAGEADAGEATTAAPGQPTGPAPGASGASSGADPPVAATPPARPPPRRPPRFGSGVPVSPTTVRGLVPAATIMAVLTLGPWRAVNVGAKHRTLPAWLRTVLAAFHVHCRGPDCDRRASWTEAHHITPWATARTTDLNDTLPCCPTHHDLIDEGWTATLDHTTGDVTWTSPTGRVIVVPPPTPWPFG